MAGQRRDQVARGVDYGSTAVAGTVGAALGGAKLRDAYREEHEAKYLKHASTVEHTATRTAPHAGRLARVVAHGKPNFAMLATGTVAAGVAGGATKYREHRKKLLTKAGTVSAETSKLRNDTNRGQGILRSTDVIDDTIRRARLKLMPSQTKVIVRAADDTKKQLQTQLTKVYDPERRRKRTYQGAAAGAAVGSGAAVRSAVGEARDAHGKWAKSQAALNRSDASFAAASQHERSLDAQRAGMMRPVGSVGNVGGSMRARVGEMDSMENARRLRHREGMSAYRTGQSQAHAAGLGLKRVRNKTALAAGLATGAAVAHHRAHKYDYR